jgi:hypothetical protein
MKIIIQGPSLAWKTGNLDLIPWTAKVVKKKSTTPYKNEEGFLQGRCCPHAS